MTETTIKQLPEGWETEDFREVVDILDFKRKPVNSDERKKRFGDIPYYGATGQVGWIDDYLFDEELVLLGEDAAPFLEPFKDKAYLINGKSWVNNHSHVLRAKGKLINKFLLYYLNNFDYHNYVTGTTRLKLNQGRMTAIPIIFPQKEEQEQIVQEIEKQFTRLDAAVAALKKVKKRLGVYRKAVLKKAFEKKEGWDEKMIGECFITNPKKSELSNLEDDTKVSFVPMKSVSEKLKKIISKETRNISSVRKGYTYFRNGDIILAKITPCFENGKIAIAEELENEIGFGSTEFHVFRRGEDVKSKYLYYFLQKEEFRGEAKRNMTGTAGQLRVPMGFIGKYLISFPKLKEQEKIVQYLESKFSIIDKLEEAVDAALLKSERLRKSILKSAFEGKLLKEVTV